MDVITGSSSRKKHTKEKLPHDLVIEILSWLPIKHLYPLRFVSKSWFHLLTKDPQFAKLQFHRFISNHPDPSIIGTLSRFKDEEDSNLVLATEFTFCHKAFSLEFPFYQPTTNDYWYELCGISNGLLCFCSYKYKEVYIWNPLINDHITISCLPEPEIRFPGYKSCTVFAFAFDRVSNVYKVVRFFNETDFDKVIREVRDSRTQISVYTIGVDSVWRTVQVDILHDLTFACGGIIIPFVNGVFHWCKKRPGMDSRDLIVTFDLNQEVISEFMLPHCAKFDDIEELDGLLCAIDGRSNEKQIQIWVMKEYGVVSSWCKQYVVEKPEEYKSILGVTHNGEIILRTGCDDLVLYNPETDTMKDLKPFKIVVSYAYAFLGSLISPTGISQGDHNLLKRKDVEEGEFDSFDDEKELEDYDAD